MAKGNPTLNTEINEKIDEMLASHQPLPLAEDVEQELSRIHEKALELDG